MSQKGEKRVYDMSPAAIFPLSIRDNILLRAFWKRCPTVANAHSLQKVSNLLKAFETFKMITA